MPPGCREGPIKKAIDLASGKKVSLVTRFQIDKNRLSLIFDDFPWIFEHGFDDFHDFSAKNSEKLIFEAF